MARMIPAFIERDDPKRTGEYMVYDWLSQDSIPGVVFYSHTQNNHDTKTMSEVDFMYICRQGILCIEVKGGIIKKEETKWRSTNKRGETFDIKDPFWQSHGCMKAATASIENNYGRKSLESKFCVGCAVIFPECIAECEGDSVIPEIMFDARNELSEFGSFLQRALKHWADELYIKQKKRTIPLTDEQISDVVTLFEADFYAVPSMKLLIDTSYTEMLRLTEEQYEVLHSIDENERAVILGAAGTGKSLLAVEKLRQNMCKGRKVAYICFNKNMASYVEQNVTHDSEVYVGTYHALLGKYLDNSHEKSVEYLSKEFLDLNVEPEEKFELMIIDEAQDILVLNAIKCLDKFIQDGMDSGNWMMFADPNQNIFQEDGTYREAVDYVKATSKPCMMKLIKNCRNTAQIARRNSMLTNTPAPKYLNVSGPDVKAIEYTSNEELVNTIDKEIASLLAGGTYIKDIVVLSSKKLEKSALKDVKRLAGIDLVEVRSFKGIKKDQVNYLTVQSFKGLESKVIFYVDIDGFESINDRRINYVALSRAQILLYYFYNSKLKNEYDKTMLEGMTMLQ